MENQTTNPFDYVKATEESIEIMDSLRAKYRSLNDTLMTMKPSREKSLAMTKLEESAMWANKGIVLNQ